MCSEMALGLCSLLCAIILGVLLLCETSLSFSVQCTLRVLVFRCAHYLNVLLFLNFCARLK
jgi:hypothetical protein